MRETGTVFKRFIKRVVPQPMLKQLGKGYIKETHINRALKKINGQLYVEIGVRRGECFRQIDAPTKIGIDPARVMDGHSVSGESFYDVESDVFFSEHADHALTNRKIDVALVDGLHEFKQTLRDILNLERYMSLNGIIFVHDCNPVTRKMAEEQYGGPWSGDVWKVACYLTQHRTDLNFFTLDCDFGVGVLSGFSGRPVDPADQDAVNACKELDYDVLAKDRRNLLRLRPPVYSRYFFAVKHARARAPAR